MPTYTFTGPKVTARRTGECPTCGKQATRTRTFEHTVNPFNKNSGTGEPKTWDEVHADVHAEAHAWTPGPEVFEHESCLAARTAPPRAEPIKVSPARLFDGAKIRTAIAAVVALTENAGLPMTRVSFELSGGQRVAEVAFVPAGEIIAWARALGITEASIEDGGHCTYVRLRADVDGVQVKVHAYISRPSVGDPLGGAPAEWKRDRDTNRKTGSGTVTVDALAEGLAVMGIAVVEPNPPFVESARAGER